MTLLVTLIAAFGVGRTAMTAAVDPAQIGVTLLVAIIAASGAMAVGWRRLQVLGSAEKGKLQAEKADIIQTAEDRATGRALEALKLALDQSEVERVRAGGLLDDERKARVALDATVQRNQEHIAEMHERIRVLEQEAEAIKTTAYQSLLQTIPDAIIQAGPDGRIRNINKAALELFGYRLTEIIDRPLTSLMPARYHDAHRRGFERALAAGTGPLIESTEPVRLSALCKDGSEIEIALRLGAEGDIFTAVIRPWISKRNGNGNGEIPLIDPEG